MTKEDFRAALKRLGLTQSEAARHMDVPRLKVWRWYNGVTGIKGEVAALLECWERAAAAKPPQGNPQRPLQRSPPD